MDPLTLAALVITISGIISFEIGISTSIIEIVGGMIAGMMFLSSDFSDLQILAHIGMVSLMYIAGLEVDFDLLRKHIKPSLSIGGSSFFTPFFIVTAFSHFLMGYDLHVSILIGIALSTTSVAIVYPVLLESGPLSTSRKKILCATMVTDLLSMILLSYFFSNFGLYTVELIVFLSFLAYMVPHLGSKTLRHYCGNTLQMEFRIILLLILGLAIMSEHAGIEAAITSFLAGMITSGIVIQHEDLQEKLKFPVLGFLAPVFFFTVGVSLDFLSMVKNVKPLLLFFALCFVAKYVGTYIPTKKFMPEKAKFVGFLFNSRLSIGIIACQFGYEKGYFNKNMHATLIGVIVLAAFASMIFIKHMGGYVSRKAYDKEKQKKCLDKYEFI